MRLYRTLGTTVWYGTQADAKLGGKEYGGYEQVDVPTDKEGLLDWLNANTVIPGRAGRADVDPLEQAELRAVASRSIVDQRPLGDDGHPEVRSAFTVAQVAACALPKSASVQDICHAVAKLRAPELGYVALEVMVRAAKLGGVAKWGDYEGL